MLLGSPPETVIGLGFLRTVFACGIGEINANTDGYGRKEGRKDGREEGRTDGREEGRGAGKRFEHRGRRKPNSSMDASGKLKRTTHGWRKEGRKRCDH